MKKHELSGKGNEPKLNLSKEKVRPFDGNYQTIYQDYVEHKLGDGEQERNCCFVTRPEKEQMLLLSARNLLKEPEFAKKVYGEVREEFIPRDEESNGVNGASGETRTIHYGAYDPETYTRVGDDTVCAHHLTERLQKEHKETNDSSA